MDTLFNCPRCGFEEVFDVDEGTTTLCCPFCKIGTMERMGVCEELSYMVKGDK